MEPVLQAVDISRRFGEYQALKPTHFDLSPGQTVILSGPNGAGKSTLLLVLSGLLAPTTGQVVVDGHNLYEDEPAARRALAYVPDVPAFYHELTAWEHLSSSRRPTARRMGARPAVQSRLKSAPPTC